MAYVGTQAWAAETGGRIRVRDGAELIRLAALTGLIDVPRYLLYRVRQRGVPPPGSLPDASDVPSTAAAKEALTQLNTVASDFVVNHSIRTYWFSRLIGESAGLTVADTGNEQVKGSIDNELLYVASLAHDVGLCTSSASVPPAAQCFSIRSADWATDIAKNAGWSTERTDRLGDAITLNLNGRVSRTRGLEAHLMMRGVLADVTGLYAWCVDATEVQTLFQQVPRLDQRTKLLPVFRTEADRFPDCRGRFALRWLGFGLFMTHPPRSWT